MTSASVGVSERSRVHVVRVAIRRPLKPGAVEGDVAKVVEPSDLGFDQPFAKLELHGCLDGALRFLNSRSTTLSFVHNALSLSREKTAEESYLACRKSFEDKQDRGVGGGTDHNQRGDAQKSRGVPYQNKRGYYNRCKNTL